jgi:hypothetical protein
MEQAEHKISSSETRSPIKTSACRPAVEFQPGKASVGNYTNTLTVTINF